MDTTALGNLGETRILYEFVKNGVQCFIPHGDGCSIDLIALFNNKLNRIQIKTCEHLSKNGAMEWKVTRQNGYHGIRATYNVEDIDYFAFYCKENDVVCLVPFTEDFPTTTFSIRPDNYSGNRTKTMRFASDYTVEKIINGSMV